MSAYNTLRLLKLKTKLLALMGVACVVALVSPTFRRNVAPFLAAGELGQVELFKATWDEIEAIQPTR